MMDVLSQQLQPVRALGNNEMTVLNHMIFQVECCLSFLNMSRFVRNSFASDSFDRSVSTAEICCLCFFKNDGCLLWPGAKRSCGSAVDHFQGRKVMVLL